MKVFTGLLFSCLILSGCGGSGSSDSDQSLPEPLACDISNATVSFSDEAAVLGELSGDLAIFTAGADNCNAKAFTVSWLADESQLLEGELDLSSYSKSTDRIILTIPQNTVVPATANHIQITPKSETESDQPVVFSFNDNGGLTDVKGPGGNEYDHWYYGEDRPALKMRISRRDGVDYCQFDNGNVLIHDANYEKYQHQGRNVADDFLYPAYEFDCTESKVNNHRKIMVYLDESEDQIVQTYSMINDAMYYGDVSFNMFEKYLSKRPLEKARIRVHYGSEYDYTLWAHWDGAYVNLNDVLYEAYGSASLATVSHEIAHGVLQKHTALKHNSEADYTNDGRTLHEAFADMASIAAHYELYDELQWVVGEENQASRKRYLDKIETESGAIPSYFDYEEAYSNFYKRMGMMTYPFYLLTQQWGVEKAFQLFLDSAQSCWNPNETLLQAAVCVQTTARQNGYSEEQVIESFRSVKIKLKQEDTLAHFKSDVKKLRVQFEDATQSDRTIVSYAWDFGDGQSSTAADPYHEYAEVGTYRPKLTVTDHTGLVDIYERSLSVTDQYCGALISSNPARKFTSVEIAGQSIAFDEEKYDYTDQVIQVNADTPFNIKVEGTVENTNHTDSEWYVWVDLDDNGHYEDLNVSEWENGERFYRLTQTDLEYSLDANITIPSEYVGKTLYMRFAGGTLYGPCNIILGSSVDIQVKVN